MGFFDLFRQPDINQGVKSYQDSPGAVLLDVRSPGEYRGGHIPGSINIPLNSIDNVNSFIKDKDANVYVYCQSGARSRQAVSALQYMGYSNVNNIGGIALYSGKVER